MDFHIDYDPEIAFRLFLSFIIGAAIGFEREFRSKAAGLRTMIVICIGSTIFTEISISIGAGSPDRIASNIITGIGFLGAGVIFKDGLTISGITTATTIWISAALGMAVGAGEYFIALIGSVVTLIVLTVFEKVKLLIIQIHHSRSYKITVEDDGRFMADLEAELTRQQLKFKIERNIWNRDATTLLYEIHGREKHLERVNEFLKLDPRVSAYEY